MTTINAVASYIEGLKRAGLRLTPQRLALCRQLAGNREHPTAAALYRKMKSRFPTLSLPRSTKP